TATVAEQESEDPARSADVSGALTALAQALPVQRTALLTGAQRERELEAAEDPDPELASPPPPSDAPRELVALLAVLVELRDVGTMAARQISGSLARPVAAMAAHAHWSALRLQAAAGEGEVPAAASIEEIVPTREVPETDPPSIGAESDHHLAVETAQQQEWYAGYVHEVLAARTEDEAERSAHLESSTRHRTRAQGLAGAAEEDGAPVVARQAVYALPGGTLDDRTAGMLPTQLAQGLLVTHLAVVGAAPFERRPLSIAAALEEAGELASLRAELEPVPSLVREDQDLAPQDEEPEAGGGSARAHHLGHPVDDLLRGDLLDLPGGAVAQLDHAGGQTATDHHGCGQPQQLGVLELHARGDLGPVVVEHLQALGLERGGDPLRLLEDLRVLAGGHDVHIGRGDGAGPDQALLVVVQLGDGGDGPGHPDPVGAHGHHGGLAIRVEDLQIAGFGVLASQREDVAHLHAAGQAQRARAVRGGVPVVGLGGLDGAFGGEVAAVDQVGDVLVLRAGPGHPGRARHHPGIDQIPDPRRRLQSQPLRPDVALGQHGMGGEVGIGEGLGHRRGQSGLQT